MKRADHHREAERLLSEARKEQDSIRRSLILAEAQVHATLALGDPGEMSLASPGQDQAAGTKSAGAHSDMREGGGLVPGWPTGQPYPPSAPGGFPRRPSPELRPRQSTRRRPELDIPPLRPAAPEPAAGDLWQQQPRPTRRPPEPGRPAGRRPAPDDPDEEEPDDPGEQEPGRPGEQEPGGPGEQEPGGPGEQEPGGFTPFSF